jgi:hypothetical protein
MNGEKYMPMAGPKHGPFLFSCDWIDREKYILWLTRNKFHHRVVKYRSLAGTRCPKKLILAVYRCVYYTFDTVPVTMPSDAI